MAKRGRPKSSKAERKESRIALRVSNAERRKISSAAGRAGVGISTWIRMIALREAKA